MKPIIFLALVTILAFPVFSQQTTDLEKLVETERAFARVALEKGTKAAFLEYLADDGIIFQPTAVNGKEFWKNRPESPALLSWEPVWADINSDGTLGYTTGPWEYRPNGKDDEPVAFGQYVTIWERQKDGAFKAVIDIGISHGKPEGPTPKLAFPVDAGKGESEPGLSGRTAVRRELSLFAGNDVRVYRDGRFPITGNAEAKKALVEYADDVSWSEIVDGDAIFSKGGFLCEYGVFELKTESGEKRWNYLKIFKSRGGSPVLVLDLLTSIPE